jgi:hypothetical protein
VKHCCPACAGRARISRSIKTYPRKIIWYRWFSFFCKQKECEGSVPENTGNVRVGQWAKTIAETIFTAVRRMKMPLQRSAVYPRLFPGGKTAVFTEVCRRDHISNIKQPFMKQLFRLLFTIFALFAISCNRHPAEAGNLQGQIDSLRSQLRNSYKPGMGEIMSSIQLHHAKLWFAGENKNWVLAGYNESLIRSALKRIQTFHGNTFEAKAAPMIDPAMDSVRNAITRKDIPAFERSYNLLTITCNSCHAVTNHAFNRIIVPTGLPVSDQDFRINLK